MNNKIIRSFINEAILESSYKSSFISLDDQIDAFFIKAEKYSLLKDKEKKSINVKEFAENIARLIINYNNLLDIPSVIVNKSVSFLKRNYNKEISEEFKESLQNDFNVELSTLENLPKNHYAMGAYTSDGK